MGDKKNEQIKNLLAHLKLEEYDLVEDTLSQDISDEYRKINGKYDKFFLYRAGIGKYDKKHNEYLKEEHRKNVIEYCDKSKKYKMKDPDEGSELLQKIYKLLWPNFEKKPYLVEKNKIASDTMTSAQNFVNAVMKNFLKDKRIASIYQKGCAYASTNSSIALAANNEKTEFYKQLKKICPNLEKFVTLYHTIGNYCPVPVGFNSARSGSSASHDFWDLTLMKIREWYLYEGKNQTERDNIIQHDLMHGKGCQLNCMQWLESFGDGQTGWEKFVNTLFMQDYVDENYEVKPFWTGHNWKIFKLPDNKEEVNKAVEDIISRIVARSIRIIDACKE